MGMTKEEFRILVKGMKSIYPQATFIPDQTAYDMWFVLLQDLSYQNASKAIQRYMVSEKFPPTPADIREYSVNELCLHQMSELEAWSIVYKAICNSNYNADAEFDLLPVVIQKAVGCAANLREWAQMDNETVQSVEQSHFIRSYRAAVERQKMDAKLPENLKTIQQKQQDLIEQEDIK